MQNNILMILSPQMQLFLVIILALIMGSFASLFTHRLATKQSLVFTRSKCLKCNHHLHIRNLIPIFSWLIQKGKCSFCHAKISPRYPLIELGFLVIFLVIYYVLNQQINSQTILYFAIATMLLCMIIVDLEHYFIPDVMQYILTIFVGLLVVFHNENFSLLIALRDGLAFTLFAIGLWIFFYFGAGISAIGVDDLKFFFIAGILLGIKNFIAFMMICGLVGVCFGMLWQKLMKDETFPFAPAMCVSALVCLLFGQYLKISEWLGKLIFLS